MKAARIMLAGVHSGCGKTTVTCALMKALSLKGLKVAPYKCGPDYIDPMFHTYVTGCPSVNLDSVFVGEDMLRWLISSHSYGKDVSIIEGVMGYYDGQGNGDTGSAWDVAVKTNTPVILIVRPSGMSLSLAALLWGYKNFRSPDMVSGIIFNGISERMYTFYRQIVEQETGIPVLGWFPEDKDLAIKSRHLGLMTVQELPELELCVQKLGETALKTLDIERILKLAQTAGDIHEKLPAAVGKYLTGKTENKTLRLAVARDKAFSFYYEDNLDFLGRLGVEIVPFSPLADATLPENIHGIYIGGGYPEVYAKALSANTSMLSAVYQAAARSLPMIAECGGYMYLGTNLMDLEGKIWPMAGVLPAESQMTQKLGPFGYVEVTCRKDSVIGAAGMSFTAHEFHYSYMTDEREDFVMEKSNKKKWQGGFSSPALYAAYPHLYFYNCPILAVNFVRHMKEYRQKHIHSEEVAND